MVADVDEPAAESEHCVEGHEDHEGVGQAGVHAGSGSVFLQLEEAAHLGLGPAEGLEPRVEDEAHRDAVGDLRST